MPLAQKSDNNDCATASSDLKDCNATVGELNTCLADQVAAAKSLYATFDTACDGLTLSGDEMKAPSFEQPASCKALASKCPKLAGSQDD
jgi:hypothetical protein